VSEAARTAVRLACGTAVLLSVAAAGVSCRKPGHLHGEGGFRRGMVFGLFARTESEFIETGLDEIRALGADSISITIPWVTPNVRSVDLAPRSDMTPGVESLRRAVREAHDRGMSVLLMPFIYVDQMAEGEWRGTLVPRDWGSWFANYARMVLRYARLAEDEGVEILSVGSELCSTEDRREDWLALIGEVRKVYGGALTYSANWDHRFPISFAGALDYLGMNAYFELSDDPEAGVGDLRAAWAAILKDVEAWRSQIGKPLLLTEVGYPSRRGAAKDPWDYASGAEADPAAQERCYRAFVEAWTGYPALAGVYFYLWWGEGGPTDTGYTPRNKPAREVVSGWYRHGSPGGDR